MTVSKIILPTASITELKEIVDTVGSSINKINQHVERQQFSDFGKADEGAVFWQSNPNALMKDLDQNRVQLLSIEQIVNSKVDKFNIQSSQETNPAKKEEFQKEIASLTGIKQEIHQIKATWQKCHSALSAAVAPDYSRPDIMEIAKQTCASTQRLVDKFKNIPESHPTRDLLELNQQHIELFSVEENLKGEIERLEHELQITKEKAKGTNNNSEEIKAEGIEKKIAHLISSKKEIEQAKREWLQCYRQYQQTRVIKTQQSFDEIQQKFTQKKKYQIEDLAYRLQRELQSLEQDKYLSIADRKAVQTCLKDLHQLLSASKGLAVLFDEECRALLDAVIQGEGALVEKTFLNLRLPTQQTIIAELNSDPSPSNNNSFVGAYGLEKIKSALLNLLGMPEIKGEIATTTREKHIEEPYHCLQHLPDEILLKIFSYLSEEDAYSLFRILAKGDGHFLSFPDRFKELKGLKKLDFIADDPMLTLQGSYVNLHEFLPFVEGEILCSFKDEEQIFLSRNSKIEIVNLKTKAYDAILEGHTSEVTCLIKEGHLLYSASQDGMIKIWDLTTRQCVATLQENGDWIECLFKEGHILYSGSWDDTIKIWDLTTRQCVTTLGGHKSSVLCLFKEGNFLYSGSFDKTIKIWDLTTRQCIATLRGHESSVLRLFKEGNFLYSGSADKTIKIWDLTTRQCITTLQGHEGSVYCLCKEGNLLYSGSWDKTIKIWDLTTLCCTDTLKGHEGFVKELKMEGKLLVSSAADGINVWDLNYAPPKISVWDLRYDPVFGLMQVAGSILTSGECSSFSKLLRDIKDGVYQELCAIEHFSDNYQDCAEHAFLKQQGQTTSDQKRSQAIYRFLLREIVSRMGSKKRLSSAKKLFKALPDEVKNAVYEELFQIVTFENSYWGCAEHAFLSLHGQNTSNERRHEAILNYLNNTLKK